MDEHAPIVYDVSPYMEETKGWDADPSAYLLRYYTKYYFLASNGKPTNSEKIIDQLTGLEVLRGDQYVYQSPNKLCVTGLAPTHPLIAQRHRYKVLSLRFDQKIMAALPQPTAIPANSKKQPPPPCHVETVICKIEAQDLEYVAPATDISSEDTNMTAALTTTTSTTAEDSNTTADETSPSTSEQQQQQPQSGRDAPKPKESVDPSRVMFVIRGAINCHVMELNERLLSRSNTVITDPTVISTMLDKASTHGFIAVLRPKVDKTEIALEHLCPMDRYEAMRQNQ